MNIGRTRSFWLAAALVLLLGGFASVLQMLPSIPSYWINAFGRVITAQVDRLTAPDAAQSVLPGPFPGQGDDSAPSLGTFTIFVAPDFQPLMVGYPGYNGTTQTLTSPNLYDPTTVIGRSDPHLHGSAPDINGTPVGTAGVVVSDSSFSIVPSGFQGPPGTREVHTRIADFNISALGGLVMVRAGDSAPNRPHSVGEVESLSGASGDPNQDFPAESFFDVFVEVDLPAFGSFPGGTLFNQAPLLVLNNSLLAFPPHVVYIHGQTPAVPILFLQDDPGNAWLAGDLFGWLSLAGHGMNFTNSVADVQEFQNIMRFQPSMPIACQTFRAVDHNGDAVVDLRDIILIANRWPADADIQAIQDTAADFGAGCLVDPPPPLLVTPGDDVFHTPPGQSMAMLNLPAGFFGPGSDPFIGTVQFIGTPISGPSIHPFQPQGPFSQVAQTSTHRIVDARQAATQGDTVVSRLGGASLHFPGSPAGTQTVPIEITALSLTSAQPIVVTYNGGQNPDPWSVQMQVNPNTPQAPGAMTLTRTGEQNGTFTFELPVASELMFRRVNGTQVIGPVNRVDTYYGGFGTNSPLGQGYNTGPPIPWTLP